MRIRTWTVAALALLAIPLVAGAGVVRSAVHGRLAAVAQGGTESGRFRLIVGDRSNSSHIEKIEAEARQLDSTIEYHVFLVKSGGTDAADFGAMHVGPHGHAGLRFTTRLTSLPSGVTTISDYAGGTVEVRDGSTAVLSGTVPNFIGLTDPGSHGSAAFGHDRQRLTAVDTSFRGRGVIIARRQNLPGGVREEMRVTCGRMDSGATYTAVIIATDLSETSLGTFTTSDPLGLGGFRLATARGDTIPGGSILDLAGQTVEVRDSGGTAVLRGTFPTLP